jgi:ABC-type lipoprotein release transport system permease subunit
MEWSTFAFILLIVACIAVGVTSAVVRTWALHSRTYSLEDRIAVLEGTLTREVKTRAATERWRPKKDDASELLALQQLKPVVSRQANWWERPDLQRSVDAK